MERPYDITVFGATGFTGQFVVRHLALALKDRKSSMSWAVAGRNESKLKKVLSEAAEATGLELDAVATLTADVADPLSLKNMAEKSRLVLNCVGPYRFYGRDVVSACVDAGTHHLDISGEPQFLERTQLDFDAAAKEKGVYVIGSCGFDSIPCDLGSALVHKAMQGPVNAIETYLEIIDESGIDGPSINFATFQSAVYGFAHAGELKSLRKKLWSERLPKTAPKLKSRGAVHRSKVLEGGPFCLNFPGSDRSVVLRSERFRHDRDGLRPAQVGCYFSSGGFLSTLTLMIAGVMFGLLASFKFGRWLLETWPGVFTFGAVTKEGPPMRKIENTNYRMTLVGRGWGEKSDKMDPELNADTDRTVRVEVKGKNIGYGSTCECLVQAGITVLEEGNNMPDRGGVFTPGYAFADTSLLDKLTERGTTFEVVSADYDVKRKIA